MISYWLASGGDHSKCACQLRPSGELLIERQVTPTPVHCARNASYLGHIRTHWCPVFLETTKKDY